MGMAGGAVGLGGLQQPVAPPAPPAQPGYPAYPQDPAPAPAAAPPAEDPVAKLQQFKQMLDAGLITQADYDAAKAKALGL